MLSDDAVTQRVLADIAHHLDLLDEFVRDFDYARFVGNARTLYAVIRCLEIISEASRRLPDDLKQRHRQIAWRAMAGAGNVYRHDYEDVAVRFVWNTLQTALPDLRRVIEQEHSPAERPPRR